MKILVNGCSFSFGHGMSPEQKISSSWPNLLARELDSHCENISFPGSSNLEIFLRTLKKINETKYDLIIIQWSALRRHWFEPGIDRFYICAGNPDDHKENWIFENQNIYIDKKQRKKFSDMLTMLSGDYRDLLDLCCFMSTLQNLCSQVGTKILYLNGLLPWTPDLLVSMADLDMSKNMSPFTKSMLEFDFKDDDEIRFYHENLRKKIAPTEKYWINMFDSWSKFYYVDTGDLGHHPGPKSHSLIAEKVISKLTSNS